MSIFNFDFFQFIWCLLQICKTFKLPKIEYSFGKKKNMLPWWANNEIYEVKNNIFTLFLFGIGYKTKFGEFRYESFPRINMFLFDKWELYIGFRAPGKDIKNKNDMLYYESILDYVYTFNKDIIKTFNNHECVSDADVATCSKDTIAPYLKKDSKIICLEYDAIESHREYVEKVVENRMLNKELQKFKSEISHSGSNGYSLTRRFNSEFQNNLSSGINRKTNDLS